MWQNSPRNLEKMKVAIVHEMLIKLGGAERVVQALREMFPTAPIFTSMFSEGKCGRIFKKESVRTSFLQKFWKMGVPLNVLRPQMPLAFESFDLEDFDLVISSSSAFAHGILTGSKHLCFCHSPARFLWDWHFQILKNERSLLKKYFFKRFAHNARVWDLAAANRPTAILANSKNVQGRIAKFWRRESQVVFPPVNTESFTPTAHHENYFLIVSALQDFKKIEIAVRAFSKLRKHKLLVIGEGDRKDFLQSIAGKNVEFLGRKSDGAVREFLENCRAFIFTAVEDFGIAPVEAMAAGKPVIGLRAGGLLETVVENESGVFFNEQSESGVMSGLEKFFAVEKQFNHKQIAAKAEKFSRKNFEKAIGAQVAKLV